MTETRNNEEVKHEVLDAKAKLEDILSTLESGIELDSTQKAFLNLHNI